MNTKKQTSNHDQIQKNLDYMKLTDKQHENPKENLSVPYLQCKYKLGYHEAQGVMTLLLKRSGQCATIDSLSDVMR